MKKFLVCLLIFPTLVHAGSWSSKSCLGLNIARTGFVIDQTTGSDSNKGCFGIGVTIGSVDDQDQALLEKSIDYC